MPHLPPRRAALLLGAYVAALAAVVFQPTAGAAIGSVQWGSTLMTWLGLSALVTPIAVEFVLNTVLFVPLTFLGAQAVRSLTWEQWFGLALLASGTIEFVQLGLLPSRNPSLLDLAANTLGGLLGALWALRTPSGPTGTAGSFRREPVTSDL